MIRPISRGHGRSVRGAALTAEQRDRLVARIRPRRTASSGQEVLQLSSAPTTEQDRWSAGTSCCARSRSAAAPRTRRCWAAWPGSPRPARRAAGRWSPTRTAAWPRTSGWSSSEPVAAARSSPRAAARRRGRASHSPARRRPPWCRACSATCSGSAGTPSAPRTCCGWSWPPARWRSRPTSTSPTGAPLEVLLQAVTHVSTTYPGFLADGSMMPEFRSLLLDRHRAGTAAQSLGALSMAAQGVRDQLSEDVWMVLAEIERALAALAATRTTRACSSTDAGRAGAVRAAGAGRDRRREHGPRPRLVHARLRPRAGAGAAGPGLLRVTLCQARPPRPTGW